MKKIKIQKKYLIPAIIVFLILALAATAVITSNHYLNKINRVGDDVEIIAPEDEDFETEENTGLEELDPEQVEWGTVAESLGDEKLINILLVGQDRRPGEGRQRSDAMIVVSINQENKKISMISFLRDLYVQIPGYSDNRLNAAYVFGGFPLLKSALNTNFGITIDGCFEVDFNGFMALIDQIGGVDIYLTAAECERVYGASEGMNHLDGHQALSYARIRKIGTDFARTNRQRTVLLAAFDVVKQKSLTELLRLLDNALPYITTDMSNTEIYSLATKLFPLISSVKINSYYIPPDGMYSNVYIRQMAVLYPDLGAIRNILKNEYLPF